MGWQFELMHLGAFRRGETPTVIVLTYADGRAGPDTLIKNPKLCEDMAEAEFLFAKHHHRPRFYKAVAESWDQTRGFTFRILSHQINMTHLLPSQEIEMPAQPTLFETRLNRPDYVEKANERYAPTHKPRRGRHRSAL